MTDNSFPVDDLIKTLVMSEYDKYVDMCQHDAQLVTYDRTIKQMSNQIAQEFIKLQHGQGNQQILNQLSQSINQQKSKREEYLQSKLSALYKGWPDLFRAIVTLDHIVDRETVLSVMDTYIRLSSGQISAEEAQRVGQQYMVNKYNLPKDVFNKKS